MERNDTEIAWFLAGFVLTIGVCLIIVLYGCDLVQVGRFYASSQTCSNCGEKNPAVKDLDIREWDCPHCGAHHDRDQNAAINILRKAKEISATA